jgi:ferrous-iron efflux pump FieF
MKKLEQSTIIKLQESVAQFSSDSLKQLDPKQTRALLQKKLNELKSSDEENKFVTFAAFMNLISALIQISFWMMLKSMSVISSAIDSLLDFVLWLFNLFLLNESKRKHDATHNYGYWKLQWFGALSQWWVMMFFGIVLWYFSIIKLTASAPVNGVGILVVIMILDFLWGLWCVAYYHIVIKQSTNMIVQWTLKKLYAWLLFNIGIMSWLILIWVWLTYFDAEWYRIDALVGLIVAGYICINAWSLLFDGYGMLMDRSLPPEELKTIKETIDTYAADTFTRDTLRTRLSGTTKMIEFNAYFDTKKKTFPEIYKACLFLKKHLEKDIENSVVTIVPMPK